MAKSVRGGAWTRRAARWGGPVLPLFPPLASVLCNMGVSLRATSGCKSVGYHCRQSPALCSVHSRDRAFRGEVSLWRQWQPWRSGGSAVAVTKCPPRPRTHGASGAVSGAPKSKTYSLTNSQLLNKRTMSLLLSVWSTLAVPHELRVFGRNEMRFRGR